VVAAAEVDREKKSQVVVVLASLLSLINHNLPRTMFLLSSLIHFSQVLVKLKPIGRLSTA
jgi:hypothetical protein